VGICNIRMIALADAVFKALSDPTRRGIFERLVREGELTVRVLTRGAGISQPAVSKHLSVLKLASLVEDRRAGRNTHYTARPQALACLKQWIEMHAGAQSNPIDALNSLPGSSLDLPTL
jgi:DNA-binding transcriptional ArsR family regulator